MIRIILPLLLVIGLFSCKEDEEPPVVERTFDDITADFQALDFSPGVHDHRLEFRNGQFWDFRIVVPDTEPDDMRPLVVSLHGASGGNPDAHKTTACYTEPGFEGMDVIIIRPNGGSAYWYDDVNQEKVFFLTRFALDYWPVDPERAVVMGFSNGGTASWFYGETQDELFSAAIPMASSYTTIDLEGNVRVMPVPMYVIHGEDDELFPLWQTREWVEQTVEAGSDITFVVAPGLSHYQPCDYAPYVKDAAQWLVDSVWTE